jgi:hypothetical protein
MYHYELLVLDEARTRSVWLTHPDKFHQKQLARMLDDTLASVPKDTLSRWSEEARASHRLTLELAETLEVTTKLRERRAEPRDENNVALIDVLDPLVDQMCSRYGFIRLMPTAVVVRYGQEVLAA